MTPPSDRFLTRYLHCSVRTAAIFLLLSVKLHSANFTWNGSSLSNSNLSTAGNWIGGVAPNPSVGSADEADVIHFFGSQRTSPANTQAANATQSGRYGGIVFGADADAFTLTGNRLALRGGSGAISQIRNDSSNLQKITLGLTFSADYTFNTGAAGLAFDGNLSTSTSTGNTSSQTTYRRITKTGSGSLTLNGSNGYVVFTISQGTVVLGHNNALGTGIGSSDNTLLDGGTLQGDGTLRSIANYITVNADSTIGGASALTFSGPINRGGTGSRKLTISNTSTTEFTGNISLGNSTSASRGMEFSTTSVAVNSGVTIAGTITNGQTPLGGEGSWLIKSGLGTMVISGTGTYTNYTAINNGTLLLAGGRLGNTSLVTVAANAVLGGYGKIGGEAVASPVLIKTDGVLRPSGGSLSIEGALTFESGAALSLGLGSTESLAVAGAISLDGSKLNLSLQRAPTLNELFVLIDNTSGSEIEGLFSTINGGSFGENHSFTLLFESNSYTFRLVYGDGNGAFGYNLVAQSIPEPSGVALLLVAGTVLVFKKRKCFR